MKHLRRYKILVILAAIFVAGIVTGRMSVSKTTTLPTADQMTEWRLNRLSTGLELTQEQIGKIRPIVAAYSEAMKQVNHSTVETINSIIEQENREIAPMLTEEQVIAQKALEQKRLDSLSKKCRKKVISGKVCSKDVQTLIDREKAEEKAEQE